MQTDVVASAIAVIALIVSIVAVVVAKKEPLRARTRAYRDAVRDSLMEARASFTAADDALRSGSDIVEPSAAIDTARSTLMTMGPRLAEERRLLLIWTLLSDVRSSWRELRWTEERLAQQKEHRRKIAAIADDSSSRSNSILAEYDEQREISSRKRDALRGDLREKLREASSELGGYLRNLDASDRSQREVR